MGCSVCENLERAYALALGEYIEARASACYGNCTKPAARKNVEMERARYELEEHRLTCSLAASPLPVHAAPVARKRAAAHLRGVAA